MYKLNETDPDFRKAFSDFLTSNRDSDVDVSSDVRTIIEKVRKEGDGALFELNSKFDQNPSESLEFTNIEIDEAVSNISFEEKTALDLAAARIKDYHRRQLPKDADYTDEVGARLGWRFSAVGAAGIYVPGGLANYPSSVLMNAIPAKVAGVPKIYMCVPCPNGEVNPLVLYAAKLAGVDRVFKIGGAQAISAFAYGTKTIPRVDKITGPGNAYVAEAKRQVFGIVGIDMIAGPSEVLVIADQNNDPDWVAVDLMSQAEHDVDAQAILITDSAEFGDKVAQAIEARLLTLERRNIARKSWETHGAIIIAKTLQSAAHLSNLIAPEHLQICTEDARAISHLTHNAGAIFIGKWTPEAIGDYVGGPNHVLPTSGSARFSSGLNVMDFMKRSTVSEMSFGALKAIGPASVTLATTERLEAHALSVSLRLAQVNEKN